MRSRGVMVSWLENSEISPAPYTPIFYLNLFKGRQVGKWRRKRVRGRAELSCTVIHGSVKLVSSSKKQGKHAPHVKEIYASQGRYRKYIKDLL